VWRQVGRLATLQLQHEVLAADGQRLERVDRDEDLRTDGRVDLLELVALPQVVEDGAGVDVAQQRQVALLLVGVGRRRLQRQQLLLG